MAQKDELEALLQAIFIDKRRVTFITGAGISIKSGIPLYRSDTTRDTCVGITESDILVEEGKHQTQFDSPADLDDEVRVVISGDEKGSASGKEPSADKKDLINISSSADSPDTGSVSKHVSAFGSPAIYDRDEKDIDSSGSSLTSDPLEIPGPQLQDYAKTAIWDAKLELLATRDAFLVDPRGWYAHFWFDTHHVEAFLTADPNESHLAIAAMCNDPELQVTCITQNVDNLHRKAGTRLDKLVEIHGRIGIYRCIDADCFNYGEGILYACDLEFLSQEEERKYYETMNNYVLPRRPDMMKIKAICTGLYNADMKNKKSNFMEGKKLPCCPQCRSPVLPITLLFDEAYTTHQAFQFSKAMNWVEESDVIVFCGTSFSVYFTEQSTEIAREGNKEVFNVNVKLDASQFYGFHTLQNLPLLISPVEESKIVLNFESDIEDEEDVDSPLFTNSSASDNNESLDGNDNKTAYSHKKQYPLIHHITLPADQALLQILPPPVHAAVVKSYTRIERMTERRCWDVPPSIGVSLGTSDAT